MLYGSNPENKSSLVPPRVTTIVSATLDILLTPLTFRLLNQLIPPNLNILLHDPTQQYNGR